MPRTSKRKELGDGGLNHGQSAISLYINLAGIGKDGVISVPNFLRRSPWKHPGENPRLLSISSRCRSHYSSLSPSTAVHCRSRAHQSKLR
jgi:hypothetical protein